MKKQIDYYWEKLGENGIYNKCGWMDDKFGISWQIVPTILTDLMNDPDKAPRVKELLLKMSKFEIAPLINA